MLANLKCDRAEMNAPMNIGYGGNGGKGTTSWNSLLSKEMERYNEKLSDVVDITVRSYKVWYNREEEHHTFMAWTNDHVYASGDYDGYPEVVALPRNPKEQNNGKPNL